MIHTLNRKGIGRLLLMKIFLTTKYVLNYDQFSNFQIVCILDRYCGTLAQHHKDLNLYNEARVASARFDSGCAEEFVVRINVGMWI